MGDYIPPEELEKFMSKCNDAKAVKAAKATADRAKIQADNVGHRLLSKMGWKEGMSKTDCSFCRSNWLEQSQFYYVVLWGNLARLCLDISLGQMSKFWYFYM
jgi:hypothetical protein